MAVEQGPTPSGPWTEVARQTHTAGNTVVLVPMTRTAVYVRMVQVALNEEADIVYSGSLLQLGAFSPRS
jgi:hypothetical protein